MPIELFGSQFFITFLFTMAVVFGVLQLSRAFKSKAVNIVVAIVIALFAASYTPFVTILWNYLPTITWFFVILFFIAFIMQLFGLREVKPGEDRTATMIVSGLILVVFITVGISFIPEISFIAPMDLLMLIGLVLMLIIFYAAFKSGTPKLETIKRELKEG
ncbi:MAG: hypothetical protein ACE5J4_03465 [Candidatus Aenigmatarchaeota archaeon]